MDMSTEQTIEERQIAERYDAIQKRINSACQQCNRAPADVRLLAVSKTKPANEIEMLYNLGQCSFGENYLQEAVEKVIALKHLTDIEWHFIGHVQSNKSRLVATHFSWLHTLDSLKLARRLSQQRQERGLEPLNVLIQINIDAEESKSGIKPDELIPLVDAVIGMPGIALRGLMAIPAKQPESDLSADGDISPFVRMQHLLIDLREYVEKRCNDGSCSNHSEIDTLSMGMSQDLEEAVVHGSTIVRIGTALFGPRPSKN